LPRFVNIGLKLEFDPTVLRKEIFKLNLPVEIKLQERVAVFLHASS